MRPIDANGKISVSSPISVNPSTTADAPMRQRLPSRTCSPIDRVRADDRAGADLGARHDDRRRMDADAVRHHGEQQIHFGDDLIADIGHAARLRERRARLQQRHFEAQLIARDHLPAELRAVDAVQIHARHRHRPFALEHQRRGHLRQRLEHQHAGHQRHAGKMPLKEILVDRDVLVRDEPLAGLVLVHGVDQHRRVAITEAVEEYGNVDGHGGTRILRKETYRAEGREGRDHADRLPFALCPLLLSAGATASLARRRGFLRRGRRGGRRRGRRRGAAWPLPARRRGLARSRPVSRSAPQPASQPSNTCPSRTA